MMMMAAKVVIAVDDPCGQLLFAVIDLVSDQLTGRLNSSKVVFKIRKDVNAASHGSGPAGPAVQAGSF